MFRRVLIANRGEIALRILRACRELNIETVCVYSQEDRGASYLELADRTVCIGSAAPKDSYLRSDRIIAAAEVTGSDAIHPGYGFLAENAQFAEKCRACNIAFIGPSAEAMRKLGDKAAARELAKHLKVPTVPGSDGIVEDDHEVLCVADALGFPVMIKAAAGGGGRGMRIVNDKSELASALRQARQEAQGAFNRSEVYLEKFIERPRHVEVQIIGDQQGNLHHLNERDCSTQRRYQKLIEESPSPLLDSRTRKNLCAAALRLAKGGGYSNAGTFEFLVDAKSRYYFIEANTRIQVEHPVTEMVTSIDLIQAQIRAAAGEPLGFSQRTLTFSGHAIECRINAEDPDEKFRPCAGTITRFRPPGGPGVRVDTFAHDGCRISPHYDSLVAKLIVHKPTREEAVRTMLRCLNEFIVEPIKTTLPFLHRVLSHSDFLAGRIDTGFVERTLNQSPDRRPAPVAVKGPV
jgi:acetyl-CoA carboxylase biotin carboxylase subunit